MTLIDPRTIALAAAVLAGIALAQDGKPDENRAATLEVGSAAPPLRGLAWISGEPVELGKGTVVIEFWTTFCPQSRAAIPSLSRLQRQFAGSVRICGIVPRRFERTRRTVEQFVNDWQSKIAYTIAWDEGNHATNEWYDASGQQGYPIAFVVDAERRIAWIGCPSDDLEDVLTRLKDHTFDLDVARRVAVLQKEMAKAKLNGDRAGMLAAARKWTALEPTRAEPWIARFVGLAGDLTDADAALACTKEALERLAGAPSELAEFANRGLFAVSDATDCHALGLQAVRTAFAAQSDDPQLALAYFSALAANRQDSEAGEIAARAIELAGSDTATLARLARHFADRRHGKRFADRALDAVRRAIEVEPDDYQLDLLEFALLAEQRDDEAATAVGKRLIAKAHRDEALLNDFAWRLLDHPALCGRFDPLALTAAEVMSSRPGGRHWAYVDTLARAKFVNGHIEEAVRLQRRAVEECDLAMYERELRDRLQMYEKAAEKAAEKKAIDKR